MRFRIIGFLCALFLLTFLQTERNLTAPAAAEETSMDLTELAAIALHTASGSKDQGSIENCRPPVRYDIEWNQTGSYAGSLWTSRPQPSNPISHLPVGRTLLESINHLFLHTHQNYIVSLNESPGLKPLPVCNYYIFALRHILI